MISSRRNTSSRTGSRTAQRKAAAADPNGSELESENRGGWQTAVMLAITWVLLASCISSRIHLLTNYATLVTGPAYLEFFLSSWVGFAFCCLIMVIWLILWGVTLGQSATADMQLDRWRAAGSLFIAELPWVPLLGRAVVDDRWEPLYWEPLWLSGWSGLSFYYLIRHFDKLPSRADQGSPADVGERRHLQGRKSSLAAMLDSAAQQRRRPLPLLILCVCCVALSYWWFQQSVRHYSTFMLGFNDFGHFAQRIANTAAGRGMLKESPVLPMFWDHFNPGLLLLVPVWQLWPSVYWIFALQAACLALSALVIYGIARQFGYGPWAAVFWGAAWVAQPCVGQMNIAYTYGWHPITLAIPLMLGSIYLLLQSRFILSFVTICIAMSMEEGVIVASGLFAATAAWIAWLQRRQLTTSAVTSSAPKRPEPTKRDSEQHKVAGQDRSEKQHEASEVTEGHTSGSGDSRPGVHPSSHSARTFPWPEWIPAMFALFCLAVFVLVYRFSGLADFQTGRFVSLGDSVSEILLSPLQRPRAFWGELLQWRKLAFVMSLLLPCFLPALAGGWRWGMAAIIPLGVLLVWDHDPATNLGFQYPSVLLPILWFSCLYGSRFAGMRSMSKVVPVDPTRQYSPTAAGAAAAVTGLVLSLFVGQLPYSSATLSDVRARTYSPDLDYRRQAGGSDTTWLIRKTRELRQDGGPVLATGRLASHLVGNQDVETVGQFFQRKQDLAQHFSELEDPLLHYRWIVIDQYEGFQQSPAQSRQIRQEALQLGFELREERFGVSILYKD